MIVMGTTGSGDSRESKTQSPRAGFGFCGIFTATISRTGVTGVYLSCVLINKRPLNKPVADMVLISRP